MDWIIDEAALAAIYGTPGGPSIAKEVPRLTPAYRRLIEASPFLVLASSGPAGLDCSPRGDAPGFVRVADESTLMIPDRRGNNRIDSLRNIVRDPRVALLFLIPGIGETMRVNGTAVLSRNLELRTSFAMGDKVPACVIVVTVQAIFTQCQKALVRSKLWDAATQIPRSSLPTVGRILANITDGEFDGGAYDAAYPERLKQTIY